MVLWDIKSVFYGMWKPLDWLVGYEDPRKGAGQDRMHGEPTFTRQLEVQLQTQLYLLN